MQKRVRTEVNPDGFSPGEGSGFLLLSTLETARRHGLQCMANIVASASGHEPGHIYSETPYKGDGLAETFTALFAGQDKLPPVSCVYASFNGENHWAKEFGVALIRNRPRFSEEYQMEHPAECFGDLGAAHGSVMLGLACHRIKAACQKGPTLVYSSSDFGDRAAVLASAVQAAQT
jgi:3-oxoacyl-[acyl-carrier-protein] synthase-1